MGNLLIKRIYEPAEKEDGVRVLIDRLWPRGFTKEKAKADYWLKDVAPSTELRKWFDHDPKKWETFQHKYITELTHQPAVNDILEYLKENKTVTLLYAVNNEHYNHALVLQQFIKNRLKI